MLEPVVLSLDAERERISLGVKQLEERIRSFAFRSRKWTKALRYG